MRRSDGTAPVLVEIAMPDGNIGLADDCVATGSRNLPL